MWAVEVGKSQFRHDGDKMAVFNYLIPICIIGELFGVGVIDHESGPQPFGQPVVVVQRDGGAGGESVCYGILWVRFAAMETHPQYGTEGVADFQTGLVAQFHAFIRAPVRTRPHHQPFLAETVYVGCLEVEKMVSI